MPNSIEIRLQTLEDLLNDILLYNEIPPIKIINIQIKTIKDFLNEENRKNGTIHVDVSSDTNDTTNN